MVLAHANKNISHNAKTGEPHTHSQRETDRGVSKTRVEQHQRQKEAWASVAWRVGPLLLSLLFVGTTWSTVHPSCPAGLVIACVFFTSKSLRSGKIKKDVRFVHLRGLVLSLPTIIFPRVARIIFPCFTCACLPATRERGAAVAPWPHTSAKYVNTVQYILLFCDTRCSIVCLTALRRV